MKLMQWYDVQEYTLLLVNYYFLLTPPLLRFICEHNIWCSHILLTFVKGCERKKYGQEKNGSFLGAIFLFAWKYIHTTKSIHFDNLKPT
jgi:hypothetical protein